MKKDGSVKVQRARYEYRDDGTQADVVLFLTGKWCPPETSCELRRILVVNDTELVGGEHVCEILLF